MIPFFFDEAPLVQALQQHHARDFTKLYAAYSPALYKVLLRLVNDSAQAEDLLQDTFVKLWTNSHRYDPSQGSLFGWILTITRHLALSELRAQKVRQLGNMHQSGTVYDSTHNGYCEGVVSHSVAHHLAPKYRAVIELIYYWDYTYLEVAETLGLPLGTVKTRASKGLATLKTFFSQDIQHYHSI